MKCMVLIFLGHNWNVFLCGLAVCACTVAALVVLGVHAWAEGERDTGTTEDASALGGIIVRAWLWCPIFSALCHDLVAFSINLY